MWPFAAIPVTSFVFWLLNAVPAIAVSASRFMSYGAVSLAVILAGLIVDSQVADRVYAKQFEDHQTYSWNFLGLSGVSTADPGVVRESVKLIEQYQPAGRPLVISRVDSLIQILTGRLAALPYVALQDKLTSQNTMTAVADEIRHSNAPVLFVDRDIFDEPGGQALGNSASRRLGSLGALAEMFRSVEVCYAPGEIRGALQVWNRICDSQ
jgi:hypothetical protein